MAHNNRSVTYHRRLIVLVGFLGCCLHSGCLIYAFGLFIKPLQAQFGWDRGNISLAYTLQFFCLGIASPIVGKAVDRWGARVVMMVGAVLVALGFFSLIITRELSYYLFMNIIIGIGGAAIGPVPCSTAVASAFHENRGLAIGVMSTGIGIGGFIFSPLIGGVLLPFYGWQGGYFGIAVAHIMLIPLIFLFLHQPVAYVRSAIHHEADEALLNHQNDPCRRSTMWSTPFYLISISFFLFFFCLAGTLQSQVPYLQDIGFPLLTASSALGILGLVSALAKLFFGWLCDRIDPKGAFVLAVIFLTSGTYILSNVKPTSSSTLLWIYAMVFGVGVGCWLPIMSMMVSTNFGVASYGLIFGGTSLVQSIGSAIGPLAAGYIYDQTHGYFLAFMLFIGLAVCSIPFAIGIRPSSKTIRWGC